ncbi:helix-turn-helix domain-containing protein [Levilactobacillus fujinensis]|uniref:Helix-turn-helix domain-containing protein n=1 Tax=Levilactobacillus fujinensis TaxID=2486024 RepID=A0ABW1TJQ4_9LACO|nr:helix-turn-helix transcriptional regulator [Levilactobacillus fujinensis]
MEIGEQIKIQREHQHWSQQELADRLSISRQSVSKWERGTALPSFANVVTLSQLFRLTIDDLIREDEHMMKHLEHPVTGPFTLIVLSSSALAIVGAIISLSLNIGLTAFVNATQSLVLIGVLGLLGLVYWNQRHQRVPLSRWVIALAIFTLTLLLVPQVDNLFMGFLDGLRQQSK